MSRNKRFYLAVLIAGLLLALPVSSRAQDTDGDGMPDAWESMYDWCGLNPLVGDSSLDADGDGLANLTEYFQDRNPCFAEPIPASTCFSSLALTNSSPLPINYLVSDRYALVYLYEKIDAGSFVQVGSPQTGSDMGSFFIALPAGVFQVRQYYTIAKLGPILIESPPVTPDAAVTVDRIAPIIQAVVDTGDYTASDQVLDAVITATDQGQSGIAGYFYAIGVAIYPNPGWNNVLNWTADADGVIHQVFGSTILQQGQIYYITGKARDLATNESQPLSSNGILVDSQDPVIIASTPRRQEVLNHALPPINLPATIRLADPGGSGIDWSSLSLVLDFNTVSAYTQSGSTVSFTASSLDLGNHVVKVQVADLAGNGLSKNLVFVVEEPRQVALNPVQAEWRPGDPAITLVADGGAGEYFWSATGGLLSGTTGTSVSFIPGLTAGTFVVAVSDAKLVSAQAAVVIHGVVSVAPAVTRLSPGDTMVFTASGGAGNFTWIVTGGTCSPSGPRNEQCFYTAGSSSGEFSVRATAGVDIFTSRVIVTDSVGRAIIVVGGGLTDPNRMVDALNELGNVAYETLLARGFGKDQIQYLNPDATQDYDGDGDGQSDDIDGPPSPAALQNAVEVWARTGFGPDNPPVGPGVPLIIYWVDHGSSDSFLINFTSGGAPQTVSSNQLDAWLDTVQGGSTQNPNGVQVTVIYDACFSGSFLYAVGGGNRNRVVISSASNTESSYFSVNGKVSWSQYIWEHIRRGETVGEAFEVAKLALASWLGQNPWLDDNGNGIYEAAGGNKDGAVASETYIGADFVTAGPLLELLPGPDLALDADTSAELYTEVINVQPGEVAAVFAILSPPGYSPRRSGVGSYETPWLVDAAGNPLPRVYLTYNTVSGRWSHVFTPAEGTALFPENGRYTATLYALDIFGRVSSSAEVILTAFYPDLYEVDDTFQQGNTIVVDHPVAQAHNFHDLSDEDWAYFTVTSAETYIIFTENLAMRCDTVLELYGPWPGGTGSPGPLVAEDDDSGSSPGASSIYIHLEPGRYYIKVHHYDGGVFGEDTEYDLRVFIYCPCYGSLDGYVTDSVTGNGVYGALVRVGLGGSNYVTTFSGLGGYYHFNNNLPAGSGYTLTVSKANYNNYSGACPPITSGGTAHQNVVLPAKDGTGVLAGTVLDGATPLSGASLVISTYSLVSESNGTYSIRLAQGTNHTLRATFPGFQTYIASGIVINQGQTTTYNVPMVHLDSDHDGIGDIIELVTCTSENDPDTDHDGLCDGDTQVLNGSTVVCARGEDLDRDGAVDPGETKPCLADSDQDGLSDGAEALTYHTNPLAWDSDLDGLSDLYEVDHLASAPPLDPMNALDASADFDGDGNPNLHESWNGSDPWDPGPVGGPGCFYWADAGLGDGIVSPTDAIELKKAISGGVGNYTGVIPNTGETHELDMDGYISPLDLIILQKMIQAAAIGPLGSRPTALVTTDAPGATVAVGFTTHVTVSVRNEAAKGAPGFGVIFEIVPASSTAAATLLGGEGAATPGARYDVSGPITPGGLSRIVLRLDSPGTLTLRARIPLCGAPGIGRSCNEIILNPAAVIKAE